MNSKPLVSVIIVNHNGKKWLKGCLDSIESQKIKNTEVILVDNASDDGSAGYINKCYSGVRIIKTKKNLGFSGGNNLGYKYSRGKYLLLINNDTIFSPNFIQNFLKVFETSKNVGIAQSKIVMMYKPNILDSCGSFWTDSTFMYYIGNGKDKNHPLYNKPFRVFSVKGASVLIKREVIEKIGLFDDDFWNYYEETDFCHRAWLAGYESWYWPFATCYHAQGGTSLTFPNDYIQYHNFKNKLMSFIKNFNSTTLLYVIPVFLLLNILISLVWLSQGKYRHTVSLYNAIWWNIKNIKNTVKKRSVVQNMRKKSDRVVFDGIKKSPHMYYYYCLLFNRLNMYEDYVI